MLSRALTETFQNWSIKILGLIARISFGEVSIDYVKRAAESALYKFRRRIFR